ncbi:agamous-like MADS-box protein AGL62 [Lotus japonicus]|uniref:agamous-like MADS-box protein AGL62 n=1 Tax=Lotus japonicus TaxID=34305 RepID=UPI002585CFC0|nr:agamous-like MADS-box protein AGL62 [Lotus japonicus]
MSTSGEQSRDLKKITNENNLQVSFCKRRQALFKKASKLCTLYGVEMAIIVLSPSQNFFSFGHPSVEDVIERYLPHDLPQPAQTMLCIEAPRNVNVGELNAQLSRVNNKFDSEMKKNEKLNRLHKVALTQISGAGHIEDMDMPQLEHFKAALEELRRKIKCYYDGIVDEGAVTGA